MKPTALLLAACLSAATAACSGNKTATETEATTETVAFEENQPMASGQYTASYYDITGENPRKGPFDGRLIVSLSPTETSGMYVYENGNRAKVNYKVVLAKPFEKGDSGRYVSADQAGNPVTVSTDSTVYVLSFSKNGTGVNISFDPTPAQTGTALEMMERISTQIQKNKN